MKRNLYLIASLISLLVPVSIYAIEGEIPIWPGAAPGSESLTIEDSIVNRELGGSCTIDRAILNVLSPAIIPFIPENPNGTAVIICPGGAYQRVVYDVEGVGIAEMFKELGVTAFVLKYRLPVDGHVNKQYVPLQDAQRAMRYVKNFAATWNIDTSKIGIMGCSAGGHAAASLATDFDKRVYTPIDTVDSISARPYFMIELYPVISMEPTITHVGTRDALIGSSPSQETIDEFSAEKHVTSSTPPAFFARAADDGSVKAQNSILFVTAMRDAGVNAHFNTYKNGGHGKGICKATGTDFARWVNDCKVWMDSMKLVTYTASDDATLKDIKVNNVSLSDFNPDTLTYSIELPEGTTVVPYITPTVNFINATTVVTNATALPGTSTIDVTAHNNINKRTYTLNFTVNTTISSAFNRLNDSFKIFPNPVSSFLTIENVLSTEAFVQISDAIGKTVFKGQLNNGSLTIDTRSFTNGIYFVSLLDNNSILSRKVIIR